MSKEQDSNAKKKKKWEVDQDYIAYCKRGDSAAVYITRDASELDTSGKWIDIIAIDKSNEFLDAYYQIGPGHWRPKFKVDDDVTVIKSFTSELFPRLTKPDYSGCSTEEQLKYVTWKTATEDILTNRRDGYVPRRYHLEVETFSQMELNKKNQELEKKWHYRVTKLIRIK